MGLRGDGAGDGDGDGAAPPRASRRGRTARRGPLAWRGSSGSAAASPRPALPSPAGPGARAAMRARSAGRAARGAAAEPRALHLSAGPGRVPRGRRPPVCEPGSPGPPPPGCFPLGLGRTRLPRGWNFTAPESVPMAPASLRLCGPRLSGEQGWKIIRRSDVAALSTVVDAPRYQRTARKTAPWLADTRHRAGHWAILFPGVVLALRQTNSVLKSDFTTYCLNLG
ncbi:translation initiation factor IF-2-like [Lutra lutra]|uniref:translation initiation factor IF-2-like n=1 Tax=Lutra lutra TaxID=9657 RepID=UPI001FD4A839|nr:translation initiation factor IF-2-like [Lutra lutra]